MTNQSQIVKVPDALFKQAWVNSAISIERIAGALGLPVEVVQEHARDMDLPDRPESPPEPSIRRGGAAEDMLRDMWLRGDKVKDIAQELGVTVSAVSHRAHKIGLPKRNGARRRPYSGSEEEALFIEMWGAGVRTVDIGKKFGVKQSVVSNWAKKMGLEARGPLRKD